MVVVASSSEMADNMRWCASGTAAAVCMDVRTKSTLMVTSFAFVGAGLRRGEVEVDGASWVVVVPGGGSASSAATGVEMVIGRCTWYALGVERHVESFQEKQLN